MSWPRGSNIRPVRIQSYSARKCARRSIMVAPFEQRSAAGDQPHRIAAGVAVDAEEGMARHVHELPSEPLRRRMGKVDRRVCAQQRDRGSSRPSPPPGSGRDGRGRKHRHIAPAPRGRSPAANPAARAEAHPLAARRRGRGPAGSAVPFPASPSSARSWAGGSSPPSSTAPPTRRPVSSGVMTKPWPGKISCRFTSKARARQRGVVAALGFQRDAVAKLPAPADATRRLPRRRPAAPDVRPSAGAGRAICVARRHTARQRPP